MRIRSQALVLGALAILTAALYVPFLSNPLFFDDRGIFSGSQFAQYATSPLGWGARYPAFFTIAAVHVVFGTIEAQRAVSALFHCGTAFALFIALRVLQARWTPAATPQKQRRDSLAALAAAAVFAVHPVAVYAAGYLVQRSIVLATLFALLSLAVLVRGVGSGRLAYALGAGGLYAAAVLSKEHAILLPAVALAALGRPSRDRAYYRYVAAYLAVCVPAAITAVLFVKGVISTMQKEDKKLANVTLIQRGKQEVHPFRIVQPQGLHGVGKWAAEVSRGKFLSKIGFAIVHSKTIVIDPNGDDPVVVTGSHNFSGSASSKNDENLIIIRGDSALAQAYAVETQSVFDHYNFRAVAAAMQAEGKDVVEVMKDPKSWQAAWFRGEKELELNFWLGKQAQAAVG